MWNSFRLVTVAAAAVLLVSCDDWQGFSDSQRFKEDFHESHALNPGARLMLENMNGSVEITGWEKNSVELTGTKYAAEESVLKAMRIDISGTADNLSIRTIVPSGRRGGYGAKYILRVPSKVVLDRITSSNGSIRVESLSGSARLKTSNGSVRVSRLDGPLEVQTSNASVEVNDVKGNAVVRTSNGGIRADNVYGSIEGTTSNASIRANLTEPEAMRPVKLESSNGSVELTMSTLKNNDIRINTSNSSITVRLPSSINGQVRAHTSNGKITTDFDTVVRAGQIGKNNLEGSIGSGGPVLDLNTSNGSIRILKI
jgi:DUF4097 and DUF4098 domain-containing protein YvlB